MINLDEGRLTLLQFENFKLLQQGERTLDHFEWFNSLSRYELDRLVTTKTWSAGPVPSAEDEEQVDHQVGQPVRVEGKEPLEEIEKQGAKEGTVSPEVPRSWGPPPTAW